MREMFDASPDVCCAYFQTGACAHTEAPENDTITRRLASGKVALIDAATGKVWSIVSDDDNLVSPAPTTTDDENVKCLNCKDGVYYISGSVVNGVFVGKTGVCFQCEGKGYQTPADIKRCTNYNRYHRKVYL